MDDLTMLRELGHEFDPPTPGPTLATRERVLAGTLITRSRAPHRITLRWAAPCLAVAVAGGLALAFLLPSSPVTPPPAGPGGVALDARHVLLAAATSARAETFVPPPPNAFVYTRTLELWQQQRREREAWLSVDGRREGAVVPTGQTTLVRLPGCPSSGVAVQRKGTQTFRERCHPTPAYRSDLPADADGAYRLLMKEGGVAFSAFKSGAYLLREGLVPPASVAAVLEALSRMPGISTIPTMRMLSGRAGVGVLITRGDGAQEGIIVDAGSHHLLGGWSGTAARNGAADDAYYAWEALAKGVVPEVRLRPDGSGRSGPISG